MAGSRPRKQNVGKLKDSKRITRKEYQRLVNKFHGAKRIVESRKRKGAAGQRKCCLRTAQGRNNNGGGQRNQRRDRQKEEDRRGERPE